MMIETNDEWNLVKSKLAAWLDNDDDKDRLSSIYHFFALCFLPSCFIFLCTALSLSFSLHSLFLLSSSFIHFLSFFFSFFRVFLTSFLLSILHSFLFQFFLSFFLSTHCYIYIYIYSKRDREKERKRERERERDRERDRERNLSHEQINTKALIYSCNEYLVIFKLGK